MVTVFVSTLMRDSGPGTRYDVIPGGGLLLTGIFLLIIGAIIVGSIVLAVKLLIRIRRKRIKND